ncbi:MAG: carboxypeptidase regulatory-like domain-containing protein, partial [Alcanivoracaceae bacterium]|nr:carboxypeptidase regulatory-like domain-containing protein [Alcanivoracaceae bacterium]
QIQLYSESGDFIKNVFTNNDGNYSINNLTAGNYRLLTESNNYINQAYPDFNCGIQLCEPDNTTLINVSTANINTIDFSLIASDNFYPNLNGLWFNQQQSGHGLQVEVIMSDNKPAIFASWYAHLNGETIWLTGLGPLNKGTGSIDLYITDGTSFPPNFIADDVTRTLWGTLNFEFSNLDKGNIQWQTDFEQFQNGSLEIVRLTHLSKMQSSNDVIDACQSGTYFNPNQSGHGIMLEVLGDLADSIIVTWFTYNNQNQQFWLLAEGTIEGNNASMNAIYTINSDFPPNFDASAIDVVQWGNIDISRVDNNNIVMSWQPNDNHSEYGAHSVEMTRLTKIKGLDGVDCNN